LQVKARPDSKLAIEPKSPPGIFVKGEKQNLVRLKRLKSLLAKTTLAKFDNQAQTLDSSDDHHHATLLEGEGDTAAARLLSSHIS
jgi:hypothetical protein